ncbi:MAG: RNA polymerase sigma factor RpoD, partial [Pelagibacteraceae bacterium]|nr:RNA polymerase sigma factor RpoD [Pelagibacteraceae bacterium]
MEKIITKSFARLMGRGSHRGFITYDELSKSMGKRCKTQQNLEQAFFHVFDNSIALVENKSDYKVLKKKESTSGGEDKLSEKSDDPIRMYLREMGGVELLSREGEIAIAKRIEAGQEVMLNALAQSPITARKIFAWYEKLQNNEILVREIIDIDTSYLDYDNSNESNTTASKTEKKTSVKDKYKKEEENEGELPEEANEEDEFNISLAAMEDEIKPKILKTISNLKKNYNKLLKYQKEKLDSILNYKTFSISKERNYKNIVNEIVKKINSLQLASSELEQLVQSHYVENKKILSLEGVLLRLAQESNISREEFVKFYVGNEINPNLKNFLNENKKWK